MIVAIERTDFTAQGIFGSLHYDGFLPIHTLEHAYDLKPKVPEGVYRCVKGIHQLKHISNLETFEIQVPGHTGILFHPGNTQEDSEGCILLGYRSGNQLVESQSGFKIFMQSLEGLTEFKIAMVNCPR